MSNPYSTIVRAETTLILLAPDINDLVEQSRILGHGNVFETRGQPSSLNQRDGVMGHIF